MVTPTTAGPVSGIPASGDDDIDPLLLGRKWGGPLGTAAEVEYSFPGDNSVFSTSASGGYGPTSGNGEPWDNDARGLDSAQKQYFREAMKAWADVANIGGQEVPDNAGTVGDIRVAFTGKVADLGSNVLGYAYYPVPYPIGGDIWLNPEVSYLDSPVPGGVGFQVYLHEIGHALGLAHPFDGTGIGVLTGVENTHQYTVMAYAHHPGVDGYPLTPMLYDIQAIQYLYGANAATRAGDTTYGFAANGETVMTLWDGDGTDTFDASNQTLDAEISLIAGSFSSIGPRIYWGAAVDNVAIAFGVVIENAKGGAGDDRITGNGADNHLEGGDGGDILIGGAGDDVLDGGAGDDWALFSGNFASYAVTSSGPGVVTLRYTGGGPQDDGTDGGEGATLLDIGPDGGGDGTDTVSGVEWFVFQDTTVSLAELLSGGPGIPSPPPPPPANGDPDAVNDTATTAEDQSVTIAVLANDGDPDGDALSISAVTQGASGQVTVGSGSVTYAPDADFNGNDSFTYTVIDGQGGSDTSTVTVTVTPVNDAPIAVDDSATTDQNQPVTFSPLANDSDPDGDPLQLVSVAGAAGGSTGINGDGTVTYTPDADFTGVDTLTYTVRDPIGAQASASISVQVDPPDNGDPPATITGTAGSDNLFGTAGGDVIDGLGGDDLIEGRAGGDVIRGGAGDDDIWGDYRGKSGATGGNDTLDGGAGDDGINGGGGDDRFVFAPGFGRDTITDFGNGADTLDLIAFAIAGFTALDDDGDGRIETGEGGGVFTATVGVDTVLDFGDGTILTLRGAPVLGVDAFDLE